MTREELVDIVGDEDLIFADGYDNALIGFAVQNGQYYAAYDTEAIIAKLMSDGMSREDAEEYYDFNIIGALSADTPLPCFVTILERASDES